MVALGNKLVSYGARESEALAEPNFRLCRKPSLKPTHGHLLVKPLSKSVALNTFAQQVDIS